MKKYSDYLAEHLDKDIKYSDYLAEHLDKDIKYSGYLAEHLDKDINYSNLYINDPLEEERNKNKIIKENRDKVIDKLLKK